MFGHVLVPTDFSEASRVVVRWVPRLRELGMRRVTLVHVIDQRSFEHAGAGFDISKLIREAEEDARKRLEELVEELRREGVEADYVKPIPYGFPEAEIARAAEKIGATMVVMSSRGRGWLRDVLFGSVSEGVVRRCQVPVLVVKSPERTVEDLERVLDTVFDRILVAHDFSEYSEGALNLARHVAATLGTELVVLHVVEQVADYQAYRRLVERELARIVEELRAGGIEARYIIRVGTPYKEIVRVAREEDATSIFMGFRGAQGFLERMILGSTTDAVLRYAPIPVLVYKKRRAPVAR